MAGMINSSCSSPAIGAVVDQRYCSPFSIDLTVAEKFISASDGDYTITDSAGNVLFTVDGKLFSLRGRRVVLDAAGNPIITLQQKIMTAHKRWQAFRGAGTELKDLIFSAKKSKLTAFFNSELDVFLASNVNEETCDCKIKGSFLDKGCAIYQGEFENLIAQMNRRGKVGNVVFGKDVFHVTVYPGVDYAFITALVVILIEISKISIMP